MANTIKLKTGSGSDPSASDLIVGEIAIRTDSGKLFTKKDNGTVAEISGGGGIDDGDKGDITVSNGGDTFTIDDGVVTSAKIADGTIVNADINASAAIDGSKIQASGLFNSGVITAAQHNKLAGIEANATADMTATEVLSLISGDDIILGEISSTGNSTFAGNITISSSDGGSAAAPELDLNRDSASPADADYIGQIKFTGESDDGSKEVYAKITGKIGDASSGTEDGILEIAHRKAGSNNISARFTSTDLKLINGTGLEVAGNISCDGTVDGRDIATDGTKLDTIESNATADQTASEILTALKTVDGSGSGLDSDLLDGQEGSYYRNASNINAGTLAAARVATLNQDTTGNAATATALETARNIGGVSFDGTGNINLPGVNTSGNQDTSGNAATATALATARTIAGVSFDGTANISLNNSNITNGAGYITATLTNEQVQDIVGGMVSSNTESGITVTYQDSDGTLDFSVASQTDNNFTDADHNKLDGIESGATADQTNAEIKTAYEANSNTNAFTDALLSKLNGIAASATNVTNNNQLTNGAGYITATLTNEQVQDIVGAMVSGNTESGITVTYQDSDGTLDFTVGTLNQDTTGNAASATTVNISGISTNSEKQVVISNDNDGAGRTLAVDSSSSAFTYNPSTNVLTAGTFNGALSGNASTATTLATARTIAGVSFDGSANISLNNNAITNGAGYLTSVGTSNIDDAAVTNAKIAAGAVGGTSLGSSAVSTAKIADSAVTNAKIDSMAASKLTGALPAIDGSNLTGISAGATGGGSDEVFYENDQTVTTNYTITNGKNAMAAGPITINSGVTVTVGSGETLTIV